MRRHDDGALEQVAAELGEDPPDGHLADAVAGAADALQAAGDRLRRLDLQARGRPRPCRCRARASSSRRGTAARPPSAAPRPWSAPRARASRGGRGRSPCRTGPVCLAIVLLGGELVQAQRHALGGATVVDEDDRRVVLRARARAARGRSPARSSRDVDSPPVERLERIAAPGRRAAARRFGHRLDGHLDAQVELLAGARVDDRRPARFGPTRKRPISSSGFCVALRPIRCSRARGVGRCVLAPAPRGARASAPGATPRFECATAWISSTITASTPVEHLARARGEHQVQRLRRRDRGCRAGCAASRRARAGACRPCGSPTRTSSAPIPRSGARRLRSMS